MASERIDALQLLPLEIWLVIAKQSREAWWRLSRVVPAIGRDSLKGSVQSQLRSHFDVPTATAQNSNFVIHKWYNEKGKLHRINKPAMIWFQKSKIWREHWFKKDKRHRNNDEPAVIYYNFCDEKRVMELETWYQDDRIHRDNDRPATRWYDSSGRLEREMWYQNNKLHRSAGKPALIIYNTENGSIIAEQYYMNDARIL